MKILLDSEVKKIRKPKYLKNDKAGWREGLGDQEIYYLVSEDIRFLWGYWPKGDSYVWHPEGKHRYWCVTTEYLKEHYPQLLEDFQRLVQEVKDSKKK